MLLPRKETAEVRIETSLLCLTSTWFIENKRAMLFEKIHPSHNYLAYEVQQSAGATTGNTAAILNEQLKIPCEQDLVIDPLYH